MTNWYYSIEWDRVGTEAIFMYFAAGLILFAVFAFVAYAVEGAGKNPKPFAICALMSVLLWPLTLVLLALYVLYKVFSPVIKMVFK